MSIAPQQSRAARAWLNWSQKFLAERAGVSLSTIKEFESGNRAPIKNNLEAIRRAVMDAGIELLFDETTVKAVGLRAGVAHNPTATTPQAPGSEQDAPSGTGGGG